jgi:hypothetical protein
MTNIPTGEEAESIDFLKSRGYVVTRPPLDKAQDTLIRKALQSTRKQKGE